jgi:DNA-binding MarR family transcriptional regulator
MKISGAPPLPCLCANIRRASRAITQRYEEALRPVGLTITQFTILQALSLLGDITQGRLGEILAMDSTTLTRTLGVMNRQGWISKVYGADRRERRLRLTRSGKSELNRGCSVLAKIAGKSAESTPQRTMGRPGEADERHHVTDRGTRSLR